MKVNGEIIDNDIDNEVEMINNLTKRNQNDNELRKEIEYVTKPGDGDDYVPKTMDAS